MVTFGEGSSRIRNGPNGLHTSFQEISLQLAIKCMHVHNAEDSKTSNKTQAAAAAARSSKQGGVRPSAELTPCGVVRRPSIVEIN